MSILSALFDDSKTYNFAQAFGAKDITSEEMRAAIRMWLTLYFDRPESDTEDDCQRLPALIVSKLTRTVFSEYEAKLDGTGSKVNFLRRQLARLDAVRGEAMQQMLVGGECFLKPVLVRDGFVFAVVRRDRFIPLARDLTGAIISVGTAEQTVQDGRYYTLLERRTAGVDGLTIESKLFVSDGRTTLGTQTALSVLDKYAALQPSVTLPIAGLGMVSLRTPMLNCVDGSADGVAVYAPAVGLIRNINRNERLLCDEFERGQSRIIASGDLLQTDQYGKRKLDAKVFTALDDDPDTVGISIFSPALREASYLARKQEYLRNIESQIGLKRGILSAVEAAERTATEITSTAGDYNLTIIDFQRVWEQAAREALALCDTLGQLYKRCDSSRFDPDALVIDWGDGVLFDRTRTWQEYTQMVGAGLLKPELALAWYFDLPHSTPEELAKIRTDYMPELEQLTNGGD